MELTITIASSRIYLSEILACKENSIETIRSTADTFVRFNILTEWTYNRLYDKRICGDEFSETLTAMIKKENKSRFGKPINDYYVASINSKAEAIIKSQKALQKMYDAEHEERQENRAEKVESLTEDLEKKQVIKKLLVARSKAKKAGGFFDDSQFSEYKISVSDDGVFFRGAKNKLIKLSLYQYECMIDKQIKELKTKIALINEKMKRADLKHTGVPVRATFGTKKYYKSKDTVCETQEDIDAWHKGRLYKRFHAVTFNGRHTSKDGNFQCKYDILTKTVRITLMDGKILTLPDVDFPYRGDELIKRKLDPEHPSVTYSLEYKKDGHGREYFILKASIPIVNNELNSYMGDGVIGADLNYDHIAWAEINKDGCLIDRGVIKFSLEGLNSGEAKSVLGKACKDLLGICAEKKKPLVKEKLDIKKTKLEYGNKKANRHISGFAYSTMDELIKGQAFKNSIEVTEVNPAYTSMLGKVKYMRAFGISIHCSAAYVIARRGMGFHERMPDVLRRMAYPKKKDGTITNVNRKPFQAYKLVYGHIKKIPVSFWYQKNIAFAKWKELDVLVEAYKEQRLPEISHMPRTGHPPATLSATAT